MTGVHQFNGRNYWFSWQDSNSRVRNTKWDWFNARNYCRWGKQKTSFLKL